MTKKDLIASISAGTGLQKREVELVLQLAVGALAKVYKNDDRLEIRGLGTFKTIISKPHIGNDFVNKKPMVVPSKKKLVFKMSPMFPDYVANYDAD